MAKGRSAKSGRPSGIRTSGWPYFVALRRLRVIAMVRVQREILVYLCPSQASGKEHLLDEPSGPVADGGSENCVGKRR